MHILSSSASDRASWLVQKAPRDVSTRRIIEIVAREKRTPIRLLINKSRCRADAAFARQLAMYLCHVSLGLTLTAVGEAFGRDRTTVSYACALIEDMRDDPEFETEVIRLESLIEEGAK
jgi:chromosomal replication initiation ATPase DnaA